jgi:hemolysin D
VVAHGRLVNPLPNIVLQPLETSIIQKIDVRIGQVVKKGEVLATLDPTFAASRRARSCACACESLDTQSPPAAELGGRSSAPSPTARAPTRLLQAQLASERKANFEAQKTRWTRTSPACAPLETNKHDQQVLAQRVKSLREVEACRSS